MLVCNWAGCEKKGEGIEAVSLRLRLQTDRSLAVTYGDGDPQATLCSEHREYLHAMALGWATLVNSVQKTPLRIEQDVGPEEHIHVNAPNDMDDLPLGNDAVDGDPNSFIS